MDNIGYRLIQQVEFPQKPLKQTLPHPGVFSQPLGKNNTLTIKKI